MKRSTLTAGLVVALSLVAGSLASAATLTQWNFNSGNDANAATGTLVPSTGAGTVALTGTIGTQSFAGGTLNPSQSSDPAQGTDNSAWQTEGYPSSPTSPQLVNGIQGNVSTAGYTDIVVSWDQRHSNTSSRNVALLYTTDGSTWTQVTNSLLLTAGTISGTGTGDSVLAGGLFDAGSGDRFFNQRTVNLSTIPGVANNPSFGFRIVTAYAPGGQFAASNTGGTYGGGTWRFDMVTVSGTEVVPEPTTLGLVGIAMVGLLCSRRSL